MGDIMVHPSSHGCIVTAGCKWAVVCRPRRLATRPRNRAGHGVG